MPPFLLETHCSLNILVEFDFIGYRRGGSIKNALMDTHTCPGRKGKSIHSLIIQLNGSCGRHNWNKFVSRCSGCIYPRLVDIILIVSTTSVPIHNERQCHGTGRNPKQNRGMSLRTQNRVSILHTPSSNGVHKATKDLQDIFTTRTARKSNKR